MWLHRSSQCWQASLFPKKNWALWLRPAGRDPGPVFVLPENISFGPCFLHFKIVKHQFREFQTFPRSNDTSSAVFQEKARIPTFSLRSSSVMRCSIHFWFFFLFCISQEDRSDSFLWNSVKKAIKVKKPKRYGVWAPLWPLMCPH